MGSSCFKFGDNILKCPICTIVLYADIVLLALPACDYYMHNEVKLKSKHGGKHANFDQNISGTDKFDILVCCQLYTKLYHNKT